MSEHLHQAVPLGEDFPDQRFIIRRGFQVRHSAHIRPVIYPCFLQSFLQDRLRRHAPVSVSASVKQALTLWAIWPSRSSGCRMPANTSADDSVSVVPPDHLRCVPDCFLLSVQSYNTVSISCPSKSGHSCILPPELPKNQKNLPSGRPGQKTSAGRAGGCRIQFPGSVPFRKGLGI